MPYYDGVPACNLRFDQETPQDQAWSQNAHGEKVEERHVDRWSEVKETATKTVLALVPRC